MIPGYTTLGSIEEALAQLRAQEADANSRLDAAMRQSAGGRADEAEHFRALARFRLQGGQASVGGGLDQASMRARAVLALRDADKAALDKQLQGAEGAIQAVAAEREKAVAAVARVEDERAKLIVAAETKAGGTSTYAALRAQAERERFIADEAEKKAKLSEDELNAKRLPYENDPVFMYLWKRGFGTSAYRAGGLTKMMDSFAARVIGYYDARPNYAMLSEIPARLREHATATKAAADASSAQLAEAQSKAFLGAGGREIEARLSSLRATLDALDAKRSAASQSYAAIKSQIDAFARGDDPRYKEAVEQLATTLSAQDPDSLYREALKTPSRDDEQIVERVRTALQQQHNAETMAAQTRQELVAIGQRRQQIAQVASQFRQRRYDADGSVFDNNVIGSLLQGLVIGALSSSDFWSRMEGSRHQGPFNPGSLFPNGPPSGYDGSGTGPSWSGGGGWSGGDSGGGVGGGFSGGGSAGSDGFSTGDSF